MSENDEPCQMSRRECLAWLSRAAAAAAAFQAVGGRAFAGDKDDKAEKWTKVGDLMTLKNESAVEIDKQNMILTRTDDGVACLSIFCTHKRNKLNVDKDGGISCPVHSSIFDLKGSPQGGPATRSLTWYACKIDDKGAIYVDGSKQVKQGQWAELPVWAKKK
jgi:nitrite reductase/ring-hydroxylating ferredoxin subunit